jgi:predicted PurR-regulated permease PerM
MSHQTWRYAGLGLLVFILILALVIVWRFLDVVVLALALAYIVYPVAKKLNRGRTERSYKYMTASLFAVLIVAVPVIVVFAYGVNFMLQWLIQNLPAISTGEFFTGIEAGLDNLGLGIFSERITNELAKLVTGFSTGVSTTILQPTWLVTLLVKIALFFVTTFYFVYEGPYIKKLLHENIPKDEHFVKELVETFNKICYGLFVGHFFTSVIIAIFFMIGLLLIFNLSILMLLFLTVLMFVIAFLPVIGPWLLYLPMGLWYMLMVPGGSTPGLEMVLFGVIFLTFIPDFYIRPKLVKRGADIHPLLIILGFFGGPLVMGLKGFIIGPLLLGLAQAIFSLYVEKRHILKELVEHI